MDKEVDQASVDIIKTILESENGKRFILEYFKENLQIIRVDTNDSARNFRLSLLFKGVSFTSVMIPYTYRVN